MGRPVLERGRGLGAGQTTLAGFTEVSFLLTAELYFIYTIILTLSMLGKQ